MMVFEGKTVLITGAAGGLGSAIAHAFADQGALVIAADLDQNAASALAERLGGGSRAARLDVSREADWIALFDEAQSEGGGIDILVNNAGIFIPNIPFEDMSLETWRRHFAVNADGVFLGCKHAILHMKARGGGAIVNMGSGMSLKASPTSAAYCASKAAVLMTTRTAAASAGKYNIRVNAVLPGAVPTTMLMGNLRPGQDEDNFLATLASRGALGRLATPEDIARSVLFLADPSNSAISGVHLAVDGGDMPGG